MFWGLILIFALYYLIVILLITGWNATRSFTISNDYKITKVSVVVVARNEESNILNLLNALYNQTYPSDLYEILIIDDYSTDSTLSLINEFKQKNLCNLKVFENNQFLEIISFKKRAITQAVYQATGELIVCTDADCTFSKQWLWSVVSFYQQTQVGFISAPVTFKDDKNVWAKMQTVEFASLIGSGAATLYLGLPTMCNGANMAFTKKAFLEVEGYKEVTHLASGDDEFLMHKIATQTTYGVNFLKHKVAIAYTLPSEKLKDFWNQRKRWASKWTHYKQSHIKILALFIFLSNMAVILTLISYFLNLPGKHILLIGILLKFALETLFIGQVLAFLGKINRLWWILPVFIMYPWYVVIFGLASRNKRFIWKGRKISQ